MLLVLMLRPGKALADFTINQRVFFISAQAGLAGMITRADTMRALRNGKGGVSSY
jgi:hypothetical protein